MTSPSLENLPAELIGQATEQLLVARAFGSVTALGGCTRRLHAIVLPALYKHVTKVDLQTGEDALIRAVENDELGLLKVLLERGVDPNGRFWSTLPSSVRQEMFSAQGLSRRLSPRGDGYLVSKIIQENIDGREPPPTWSPLHLAVCFVHDRLVRRLLDHGANHMAVGWLATGHPTFVDAEDPGITALHRAALRGGVAMCQLLLDHHAAGVTEASGDMLERGEARGLRALDYAVAAGHTRTVGSWLLEHGADHLQHIALAERNFPAPLNFLCARQQYRDAHYLLDRILIRTLGSLRGFLVEDMEHVVTTESPMPEPDSEEALITLVRRLLDAGVDPNALLPDRGELLLQSALHREIRSSQPEAVKVLVSAGAQLELRAFEPGFTWLRRTALDFALRTCPCLPVVGRDPRQYLQNIVGLLELGASFTDATARLPGQATEPKTCFCPLFSHPSGRYNSDNYNLFERLMELVARQLSDQSLRLPLASELMDLALEYGKPNEKLPQWLIRHYNVTLTDIFPDGLHIYAPRYPDAVRIGNPGLLSWLLDSAPEKTAEILSGINLLPLPALCNLLRSTPVLVERGLLDRALPADGTCEKAPRASVEWQFTIMVFEACANIKWCDHVSDGSATEFVARVLKLASSVQDDDLSKILTPAPDPAVALEVLAMALDASSQEPDPAVILTILKHTHVDVRTLIPRPTEKNENSNGIGGQVLLLYYLLKTFLKAHVISPSSGLLPVPTDASPRRQTHRQPSGETPLEALAAILDGQDCGAEFGDWPCHNRNSLRAHVQLDWRAPDRVGEPLADLFNPVEVGDLKARWA
ncbi:ankyrin repeat-containing domain protein [Chaetomium strumarium]|uniref:Ankyrin repeat-containing domain protein n=1 Tax=Chaetomium strumarium TaxID=1170767 RepID=A0AAJ0GWC4_9PEZI|nr:ankyrin repeat-containing domain protein [Chaetomium strumarium]